MILGETYLFAGTTLFIMGINELQNRSKKPDLMVFGAEMMAEAFAMIIRASNAEPSGRRGPYTIEKVPAYIKTMLRQDNERWYRDALRCAHFFIRSSLNPQLIECSRRQS